MQKQTNLKELSLLGTNVASVSPQLLARFVLGIPRVDMVAVIMINCSHLNPQSNISQVATLTDPRHICTIMAAVSGSVNSLQELNLSGNDLSKVASAPANT